MPLYDARCNICGKIHEYSKPVMLRDETPKCCNVSTERVILKGVIGVVDNPAFMSKFKHMY